MPERSVTHATFTIERAFDARPEQVFTAWADPTAKRRWFGGTDQSTHAIDFAVGGRENIRATQGGDEYIFTALYQDIVPDQRIVYTYDMLQNQTRMSVSVTTVEFEPAGAGTKMTFTEHGAYLDGADTAAAREHGTRELIDALAKELSREAATA